MLQAMNRLPMAICLLYLSGCMQHPGTTEGSTDHTAAPDAAPLDVFAGNCTAVGGAFPLPAFLLDSSLPEGFELASDGPTANLDILALDCNGVALMIGTWEVVPPKDLRDANATAYHMTGGGYIEGDSLRAFFNGTFETWMTVTDLSQDVQEVGLVTRASIVARNGPNSNELSAAVPAGQPYAPEANSWRIFVQDLGNAELIGSFSMSVEGGFIRSGVATQLARASGSPIETQGSPGTGLLSASCSFRVESLSPYSQ